jgi:hypothetical protein
MTHIKATEGYGFYREKGTKKKWHLTVDRSKTNTTSTCPHWSYANTILPWEETADTIELSDLCGHCAKLKSAYTVVEEIPKHIAAMPEGYRLMEEGETITEECLTRWGRGGWQETTIAGFTVGEGVYCCPIEQPAEQRIAELEKERDDLRSQIIEIEKAHDALCDATQGHTSANIVKMMQAMPPAEELEGYELTTPSSTDRRGFRNGVWDAGCYLVRTPIVQYLPTELITDELVAKHGSIVCDVRDRDDQDWTRAVLILIQADEEFGYCAIVEANGLRRFGWYNHCRIKLSDLPEGWDKENK